MTEFTDYEWLVSSAAEPWLRRVDGCPDDDLTQLGRLRGELSPERARLIIQQSQLRRRANEKFGAAAAGMFFTRTHFEQATDIWIARYKANRFSGHGDVLDLCCGIGGDLLGLAEQGDAVGWDRSPIARLLAERNVRAFHGGKALNRCRVCAGDVEDVSPEPDQPWHIDPDRRADGDRRTDPSGFSPGPETLVRLQQRSPFGAVKLAPATRPHGAWSQQAELEWISRGRQCRQLVAWQPGLTAVPGMRRATRVRASGDEGPYRADSFLGDPRDEATIALSVGRYLSDADPAIHAAGLISSFAARLDLSILGPGGGYLTTDSAIDSPLAAWFEVIETLPLRERGVADFLRARGIGAVEIKKRGVDVDPEQFKHRLKLGGGSDEAVVLLTRIAQRRIGIIARRISSNG